MDNFTIIDVPPCREDEYREIAWGINRKGDKFTPMWINRPKVSDYDVRFVMKFCGICHTDCHLGLNEFGGSIYPIVPGHELVGTVVEVGSKVSRVKVGDNVGVGCIIDSC
jgi:alcohol dehydrogenase (NADP+)